VSSARPCCPPLLLLLLLLLVPLLLLVLLLHNRALHFPACLCVSPLKLPVARVAAMNRRDWGGSAMPADLQPPLSTTCRVGKP
jgi:hypothetical protein